MHVIVVGAGFVGLSSALHLAADGHEVIVLERTGVAAGSSWGNAGFVVPPMTCLLYTSDAADDTASV